MLRRQAVRARSTFWPRQKLRRGDNVGDYEPASAEMGTGGVARKQGIKRIDWQTHVRGKYWGCYFVGVNYVGFDHSQDCRHLCHRRDWL